ncbi:MAG: guanylate kinase [Ruminococcus sp.]|nr:guanylate kinase [Ruminococcus sp.]
MSSKKGKLVLYSGASGVGKGTVFSGVKERNPNVRLSVSNTTRAPREGEIDGVHYNFVTPEEFERLIDLDGYLEYARYCGNYYGTPKKQVEDMLDAGFDVFLEIEVKGALQVMEKYPDILSIFIVPPSLGELERRLRSRGTEDEETILKRLEQAKEEMEYKDRYKFNVVNDDLQTAVDEVLNIIKGE